ncbi:hypothetical protein [Micromonospora sp. WMMD1082]|uniref:hypothetical protein n=1 Tax=Micromonospora sp. WMMD1082 TaxID=3016104 RepID=UPI0024169353|nr:hypothetical protein [Micromonospora sp. WMMD1082]MDG4798821.1 hypothetical protein [Micromonospora sp. WMMD1082]
MVGTPIPNLHGTPTHVMAVELYQGHHGDATGACVRCGERAPCPVRSHAASVITAAGEDPRWYDGRLTAAPPTPTPGLRQPGADERPTAQLGLDRTHPDHSGYHVGGRTVPMSREGFLYEREPEL